MTRTPLPPLVYQAPACPICLTTVCTTGGRFWCETCGGRWDSDSYDQDGRADESKPQCPAEVQPYRDDEQFPNLQRYRYRCVRDAGHPQANNLDEHMGARVDQPGEPFFDDVDGFKWVDGEFPAPAEVSTS